VEGTSVLHSLLAEHDTYCKQMTVPEVTTSYPPWKEERICEPGNRGLFLPGFGQTEQGWDKGVRGVLYGVALLYCFLGVSIIADVFMEAIEQITKQRKRVRVKEANRVITVYVWNSTVANLTLMALGSSAPEILLSVIELVSKDMFAGNLGPSTIVGSAAFNLLVIVSVCICSIPNGDVRCIQEQGVFFLTAVWSLFAYVWILLIVEWWSPGKIDIWEGVLTFCFLPVMITNAYLVDRWEFMQLRRRVRAAMQNTAGESIIDDLAQNCVDSQISTWSVMQEIELSRPGVPRRLGSGVRMLVAGQRKRTDSSLSIGAGSLNRCSWVREPDVTVNFKQPCYIVDRQKPNLFVQVTVVRSGDLHHAVQAKYETQNAICEGERDFEPLEGWSQFGPQEAENTLEVQLTETAKQTGYFKLQLLEATMWNDCEHSRKLGPGAMRRTFTSHEYNPTIAVGYPGVTYVLCTNRTFTDINGVLSFGAESLEVQGGTYEKVIHVPVFRLGSVMCSYRTERLTAVPGYDYEEDEGTLTWESGATVQEIAITVLPKKLGERNDMFQIILEKGTGGVRFNPYDDGGEDMCILTVMIDNEHRTKKWAGNLCFYALDRMFNMDFLHELSACWTEQIVSACLCNGTIEGQKEASVGDWTVHLAVLPWKLFYAVFAPPPCAPWLCFISALAHIGLVTALVCDLAELFGCVLDIDDSVTAITFVALGTSLPDLFASRIAAVQDEYADASIVNVTGSNAVNVFLGIGLTWSIGAIYWSQKGSNYEWHQRYGSLGHPEGTFVVIGGKVTFSTCVFLVAAVMCLLVLVARRKAFGGELGGPYGAKVLSSVVLVLLWCWYAGLSVWNSSGNRSGKEQAVTILGASALLGGSVLSGGVGMNLFKALTVSNCPYPDTLEFDDTEMTPTTSSESKALRSSELKLMNAVLRYFPSLRMSSAGSLSRVTSESSMPSVPSDTHAMVRGSQHHRPERPEKEITYAQMLAGIQDMKAEIVRWTDRFEKCEKFMRLPPPSPPAASGDDL